MQYPFSFQSETKYKKASKYKILTFLILWNEKAKAQDSTVFTVVGLCLLDPYFIGQDVKSLNLNDSIQMDKCVCDLTFYLIRGYLEKICQNMSILSLRSKIGSKFWHAVWLQHYIFLKIHNSSFTQKKIFTIEFNMIPMETIIDIDVNWLQLQRIHNFCFQRKSTKILSINMPQ